MVLTVFKSSSLSTSTSSDHPLISFLVFWLTVTIVTSSYIIFRLGNRSAKSRVKIKIKTKTKIYNRAKSRVKIKIKTKTKIYNRQSNYLGMN